VRSIDDVPIGTTLTTDLIDGRVTSTVNRVSEITVAAPVPMPPDSQGQNDD
jgi:hypothetical protein